jgi:hypothetical protein
MGGHRGADADQFEEAGQARNLADLEHPVTAKPSSSRADLVTPRARPFAVG